MTIDQIRRETKGCDDKIFLNSAGSSLMTSVVVDKMNAYLNAEEQSGGYEVSRLQSSDIEDFYIETAKLINCETSNIAFASSATDAYAKAISSIPFKNGDYILTTNDDYVSNQIAFLSLQKRFGINIIRSNNLQNGDLDLNHFEKLVMQYHPVLVSLTHIPTNSGLVQNAEAVGKICKQHDIIYLIDACQSIGQMEVDVKKTGCDFLTATGRKFLRGPRGSGFLFVSNHILEKGFEPMFIDMRGADWINPDEYKIQLTAKRFEMWEQSYINVIGLTEAIRYANNIGLEKIYEYNMNLIKMLSTNLKQVKGLQLFDKGSALSSILTFKMEGLSLEKTEEFLRSQNVYFSVSRKINAQIDFANKGIDWVVRLSPHYFNTVEEIDKVTAIIKSMES